MLTAVRLLQLASPTLPVGAYSYSQGLEWGIESGAVHDVASAEQWIREHLLRVMACYEAPMYAACYAAWASVEDAAAFQRLEQLNDEFIASRESAEPRAEALQLGFSYAAWCRQVAPITEAQRQRLDRLPRITTPVAASLAALASGVALPEALTGYVFGFAENQVMVLAKALPLGQIASQKLLFQLANVVAQVVDAALVLPEDDWSSAAPLLAIMQMQHETQYSRLFRS